MASITVHTTYYCGASTEVKLPEGRLWDDAESWGIKWGTLYVDWKDGTSWEVELNEELLEGLDSKRPADVSIDVHALEFSDVIEAKVEK